MTDDVIDEAVSAGRLYRVFRAAYAVGRPDVSERGRLYAATLACGNGALASHRSALASETGTVDEIPCTSPARTIVDLAGVVSARTPRSVFERAAARRMLDIGAIEAASRPGIRGAKALRKLIDQWRKAAPVARKSRLKSPLEANVLPLLAQRGFPTPRANAPVRLADGSTIEVDFLWAEQRFVLEADSRDFHGTDAAFERDRWRDRELMRVGFSTLRVTSLQAETEPDAVADAIVARLHSA